METGRSRVRADAVHVGTIFRGAGVAVIFASSMTMYKLDRHRLGLFLITPVKIIKASALYISFEPNMRALLVRSDENRVFPDAELGLAELWARANI
ncbi:hypothetical protein C8R44DRAFT_870990 [Mycena epipterygia]|nr:hypothetical protein C8R44DRAFT_870990 [Mycena epipterygia]